MSLPLHWLPERYGEKKILQQTHSRSRTRGEIVCLYMKLCAMDFPGKRWFELCVPLIRIVCLLSHNVHNVLRAYCGNWQPILQHTREFPEYLLINWMRNLVGTSRHCMRHTHTHTRIYLILKVSLLIKIAQQHVRLLHFTVKHSNFMGKRAVFIQWYAGRWKPW